MPNSIAFARNYTSVIDEVLPARIRARLPEQRPAHVVEDARFSIEDFGREFTVSLREG